ncbi:hypothetical protein CK5_20140 [Blautia obeum A2-162]|uniref:Uncharacterized protein n=1 Tax=Blautia obeum A2-162 TaxID=657314 RepID=D4LRI3_9FIRM|nr:hypothetical protein CK5_20140 [Blautia obeum A2-162]
MKDEKIKIQQLSFGMKSKKGKYSGKTGK